MIVKWTNEFQTDFDLEQAEEDFNFVLQVDPTIDLDSAIYAAVNANFICDGEEYLNIQPAIEICAKALRERIGGVQMRMELN